jgi:hypothetical protein
MTAPHDDASSVCVALGRPYSSTLSDRFASSLSPASARHRVHPASPVFLGDMGWSGYVREARVFTRKSEFDFAALRLTREYDTGDSEGEVVV